MIPTYQTTLAKTDPGLVTPDMVKVIMDWFTGKFMARGINAKALASLKKWRDVSTPPKSRKVFRLHSRKMTDKEKLYRSSKSFRGNDTFKDKTFVLNKTVVGIPRSWTTNPKGPKSHFISNFQGLRRGKSTVSFDLALQFDMDDYLTDVWSVLSALKKSGYKKEHDDIKARYLDQKEVILLARNQQNADLRARYFV